MVGNTEFDISQYDVFTKEEHAFLAGIFANHPAIATNFQRYLTRMVKKLEPGLTGEVTIQLSLAPRLDFNCAMPHI